MYRALYYSYKLLMIKNSKTDMMKKIKFLPFLQQCLILS